jgi:hypothetical protein
MTTHNLSTGLGRLKQLRDDLAELQTMQSKPIRFSMSRWYDDRRVCGTTACAVGYCSMQSWAKKEGLTLIDGMYGTLSPMMVPAYDGEKGFSAVSNFFEIEEHYAYYLFDDGEYEQDDHEEFVPGIEDVLPRIDEVIARMEPTHDRR